MSAPASIRLGTRSSPLALAQTELVVQALAAAAPDVAVEVVPMTTLGDRDARAFAEIGDRGIFATELERALVGGEIDAAVHSCKDLALEPDDRLELAAFLPREDPRDVLCGDVASLDDIPHGGRIATSSARRVAALALLRPDLEAVPVRGNVQTRLQRSAERGDAACMLAAAGLRRLGLEAHIGVALPVSGCVPEAGQGAVVVQVRAGERELPVDWSRLDDVATSRAVTIERTVAARLGGGCNTPVGVHVAADRSAAWVFVSAERVSQLVALDVSGATDEEIADLLVEEATLALAGDVEGAAG